MSMHAKQSGFTLIELLVVVAIIGMLASVVLASLNGAREKSRDARRLSDMRQLQTALELYYSDNGNQYPASGANDFLSNVSGLTPSYIAALPSDPMHDPGTGNDYKYWTDTPVRGYTIATYLEGEDSWCRFTVGNIAGTWDSVPTCTGI